MPRELEQSLEQGDNAGNWLWMSGLSYPIRLGGAWADGIWSSEGHIGPDYTMTAHLPEDMAAADPMNPFVAVLADTGGLVPIGNPPVAAGSSSPAAGSSSPVAGSAWVFPSWLWWVLAGVVVLALWPKSKKKRGRKWLT